MLVPCVAVSDTTTELIQWRSYSWSQSRSFLLKTQSWIISMTLRDMKLSLWTSYSLIYLTIMYDELEVVVIVEEKIICSWEVKLVLSLNCYIKHISFEKHLFFSIINYSNLTWFKVWLNHRWAVLEVCFFFFVRALFGHSCYDSSAHSKFTKNISIWLTTHVCKIKQHKGFQGKWCDEPATYSTVRNPFVSYSWVREEGARLDS